MGVIGEAKLVRERTDVSRRSPKLLECGGQSQCHDTLMDRIAGEARENPRQVKGRAPECSRQLCQVQRLTKTPRELDFGISCQRAVTR